MDNRANPISYEVSSFARLKGRVPDGEYTRTCFAFWLDKVNTLIDLGFETNYMQSICGFPTTITYDRRTRLFVAKYYNSARTPPDFPRGTKFPTLSSLDPVELFARVYEMYNAAIDACDFSGAWLEGFEVALNASIPVEEPEGSPVEEAQI